MTDVRSLIMKKISGVITREEETALNEWAAGDSRRHKFIKTVSDAEVISREFNLDERLNWERPMADMQRRINSVRRRKAIKRFSAAAAILLLIAGCTAIWMYDPSAHRLDKSTTPALTKLTIEDIRPGRPSAKISLPDGGSHELSAGELGINATLISGIADRHDRRTTVESPETISLEVPRGGEFKIILEDSTVVWLNAESSLHYPEKFAEDSRRVSVSGEAYFEVKKDSSRPFYVESGGQSVRVYGTKFNVRGYKDEESVLTTLEEGKISISRIGNSDSELFLSPGLQSRFDNSDETVTMKAVNTEVVTGWRHGKFVFEDTPLSIIMRDLSRWYNFDYEFSDPSLKDIVLMGSMNRDTDFHRVISILETIGEVRITFRDNKLIVSKKG